MQGFSLENGYFKIRMSIITKGKGKSGGARLISKVFVKSETVYLLSIYDKSEHENLPDHILEELLKSIYHA